jgi:hypothetical protein
MKRIIVSLVMLVIETCPTFLQNDQDAYRHCHSTQNTYIAIIWPIAQGKELFIKNIMNRYGTILYYKPFYFNKASAYVILQQAHQHIPNGQPHCGSMKEHLKWYFPKGSYDNPARIFVLYFKDTDHALSCKYAIRKLFPGLQYRSVHINDYHSETMQLAQFFFT